MEWIPRCVGLLDPRNLDWNSQEHLVLNNKNNNMYMCMLVGPSAPFENSDTIQLLRVKTFQSWGWLLRERERFVLLAFVIPSGFITTDHNHVRRGCHNHVRRGPARLYKSWFDSMSRWFDHELPQPRPTWLWLPRPFPPGSSSARRSSSAIGAGLITRV